MSMGMLHRVVMIGCDSKMERVGEEVSVRWKRQGYISLWLKLGCITILDGSYTQMLSDEMRNILIETTEMQWVAKLNSQLFRK